MYSAIIKFAGKLPSINQMYLPRRSGGVYLNPEIADLKQFIRDSLIKQGCKQYFTEENNKNKVLEVELIFVIKQNFWKRDCTNIIKFVEDGIVQAITVDDRFNMRVATRKVENDKDEFEYIIVVIQDFDKSTYKVKWSEF